MNNVSLFPSTQYDNGSSPSVGLNDSGLAVEVHKNQMGSSLYYHVGNAANGQIHWGPSIYYDDGNPAKCDVNNSGVAVEAHQSNGLYSNLWFHVGQVTGQEINWSKNNSQKSGSGSNPDIAINNSNLVIEVHEDDKNVVMRIGSADLNKQKISFGDQSTIAAGSKPAVALNDAGNVFITYEKDNKTYWWYGKIQHEQLSKHSGGILTDDTNASASLNDNNWAVIAYGESDLYTVSGQFEGDEVTWQCPIYAGAGSQASVALSRSQAIAVHAVTGLSYALYASAGNIFDYSNWMGSQMDEIGELGLGKVIFPAAHDAGMYLSQDCTIGGFNCNTQTQGMDFAGMLNMGIRYFDVRPAWYNNEFYTGHYASVPVLGIQGCNGGSLDDILTDVSNFAQASQGEIVLLKFSHYYDKTGDKFGYDATMMQQLTDKVQAALNGQLYLNETGQRLADIPLRQMTAQGTKVIAVFDLDDQEGFQSAPDQGLYSYLDYTPGAPLTADLMVFDEYAKSNDLATMAADQFKKQENAANHGGDLFLLSWTLTQSNTQATTCGVPGVESILELATTADAAFGSAMQTHWEEGEITAATLPNVLYVDLANGFATDVAMRLNTELYGA